MYKILNCENENLLNVSENDLYNSETNCYSESKNKIIYKFIDSSIIKIHHFKRNVLFINIDGSTNIYDIGNINNKTILKNKSNFQNIKTEHVFSEFNFEEPVFLCACRFEANFHHFIIDLMPQFFLFLDIKRKYPSCKIVCKFDNTITNFYTYYDSMLKYFNIDNNDIISIRKLNIKIKAPIIYHGRYTQNILELLSSLKPNDSDDNVEKSHNKIIISRFVDFKYDESEIVKNGFKWYIKKFTEMNTSIKPRILINGNEILNYLTSVGFDNIYFENYSFNNKIRMLNNVDIVFAELGAGIDNLIWMKDGGTVIIVYAECDFNDKFLNQFQHILKFKKLNVFILKGTYLFEIQDTLGSTFTNTPWKINIEKLKQLGKNIF